MTVATRTLSVLLSAEFVKAPVNLWTGGRLPAFTRFTGYRPQTARRRFAPPKLLAAVLIAVGIAVRLAGIGGAALTVAICGLYLLRLAAPNRRDPAGIAGFAIFGASASALLVLQLAPELIPPRRPDYHGIPAPTTERTRSSRGIRQWKSPTACAASVPTSSAAT